jgi:type I restriction enzyme, S subunit
LNNTITPDYLVAYLNSPRGRRVVLAPSAGSAQLVVNLAELNKLELQLPTLDEQTAIAEVLTDMDKELVALGQRREKTRALKQAMTQELLTGKTRLV